MLKMILAQRDQVPLALRERAGERETLMVNHYLFAFKEVCHVR